MTVEPYRIPLCAIRRELSYCFGEMNLWCKDNTPKIEAFVTRSLFRRLMIKSQYGEGEPWNTPQKMV